MHAADVETRDILLAWAALLTACGILTGCGGTPSSSKQQPISREQAPSAARANAFDRYMAAEYEPADGFDLPVGEPGSGWRPAGLSPLGDVQDCGEEWIWDRSNVPGEAERIRAAASGRVVAVASLPERGITVVVEHAIYENEKRLRVWSLYGRLSTAGVHVGEEVRRGQTIGAPAPQPGQRGRVRFRLELREDERPRPVSWNPVTDRDRAWADGRQVTPSDFVREHRTLPRPQRENTLVLVEQATYKMRLYRAGQSVAEYDVSLGQGRGQKRDQGDNRTPKGMYFVVDKRRGNFPGPYGAYYGGHWIKINYPNKFDALRGLAEGSVDQATAQKIAAAWSRRDATDESTRLGGGIGFHGWIREWANGGPRHLSWGCVVLHLKDVGSAYDQIPTGAMVVIF